MLTPPSPRSSTVTGIVVKRRCRLYTNSFQVRKLMRG